MNSKQNLTDLILFNESKLTQAFDYWQTLQKSDPLNERLNILWLDVKYWRHNLARSMGEFLTLPRLTIESVKELSTSLKTPEGERTLKKLLDTLHGN